MTTCRVVTKVEVCFWLKETPDMSKFRTQLFIIVAFSLAEYDLKMLGSAFGGGREGGPAETLFEPTEQDARTTAKRGKEKRSIEGK